MTRLLPIFLLFVLCGTVSCKSARKPAAIPAEVPLHTAVAQIDSQALQRTFIGYLESNFSATIQPRVAGFLLSKHYRSGMPVHKGDLLFTLEGRELQTTRLAAAAQLESARAQLIEAKNNYERAQPLAEIEAVSRAQLDQYRAQYVAAEATLHSAEQRLRSADLQVGYTQIYSPIDGIAASTEAHAGDYVGPGTRFEVLTTISNLDTLSVALQLPMSEYLALHPDSVASYRNRNFLKRIRLYLSDGSLYPWEGLYDHTQKDVEQGEGTLSLVVDFPNPEERLKAGAFARVVAEVGPKQGYVVVPAEAVSEQQGLRSVWVVGADSVLHYRRVEVGPLFGDRQAIRSGLSAGERVLIQGVQRVREGEKITY